MRIINLIVVHCSATRGDCTLSPEDVDRLHRRRGFNRARVLRWQRNSMSLRNLLSKQKTRKNTE